MLQPSCPPEGVLSKRINLVSRAELTKYCSYVSLLTHTVHVLKCIWLFSVIYEAWTLHLNMLCT